MNMDANQKGEMQDALSQKIEELFYMCDSDNKGYVTRDDLYRLKDELGLNDVDVENAFDQLDTDKDNFLTLEEFLTGFGLFLGIEQPQQHHISQPNDDMRPDFAFQVFNLIDKEDKGHITKDDLIEAAETLEIDVSQIDYVYRRLRGTSAIIHYEDFVNNIGSIIALSPSLQEVKALEDERNKALDKRAIIGRAFRMDISGYENDEVEKLLHEQAASFFKQCDYGNKNYVTRDDLLTLSKELSLPQDLVNDAYDRLDQNNNGYLTLREFVNGFGLFLGLEREENNEPIFLDDKYDKAQLLFSLCDTDNKGYVTKFDLNRLTAELGLTDQQIENIFINLDTDGDGFVTLDEFVRGFSDFAVNGLSPDVENSNEPNNESIRDNGFDEKYFTDSRSNSSKSILEKSESQSSNRSERSFLTRQMSIRYEAGVNGIDDMLNNVEGEVGSAISKDQLRELWDSVSSTGDHMTQKMFERFLTRVYSEIKLAKQETKHLEDVLEKKAETHNAEIKRIYDEVEAQLYTEKVKLKEIETRKEKSLREDLYQELKEKEKHLDKFMQRQNALESRLKEVVEEEQRLKSQNSKLLKENVLLEDKLNDSMSSVEFLKSNLYHLEAQTTQEKKETLKAAFQATQGIHYEHENLVKQLDMLKTVNQKLRDDKDTIEASLKSKTVRLPSLMDEMGKEREKLSRKGSNLDHYFPLRTSTTTSTPTHSPLKKQGSVLSNYFAPIGDHVHSPIPDTGSPNFNSHRGDSLDIIGEKDEDNASPTRQYSTPIKQSDDRNTDDELPVFNDDDSANKEMSKDRIEIAMDEIKAMDVVDNYHKSDTFTPSSPRRPPIGEDDTHSVVSLTSSLNTLTENPSRVYKIVFVGDSGVGKSSFIHRFCFDDFKINFTATIGVDFQVKTIKMNRQLVALQLWDTAGQERFRSITKQYFRRADGVVVMFDLSSWSSYTNVKGWMLNVEEGAEDDCVVVLLGNKKDLIEKDSSLRKVQRDTAEKLAADYNATYAEVSACSGDGVLEAMEKMAKRMEQSEDTLLKHSVLNLNVKKSETKKKKCC